MRGAALALALTLTLSPAMAQEAREEGAGGVQPAERLSPAQIRSDSLDRLFAALHRAQDPGAASRAEQKIWELWASSDSPTAEVLLRQATVAMDAGAPEEGLKILDILVERYPDFAEAWNRRATLYFLMKRYDASLADIEKVLDLEPRHFGALAGRGMIYQLQKKYSLAAEAYGDALTMNPTMQGPKAALEDIGKLEQGI